MSNPFVYYRLDSIKDLKHSTVCAVCDLDWHKDLSAIQKFYAGFTDMPINPDKPAQTVGAPLAIMNGNENVCFAIPFSFHEGETEIGGVANLPEQRNKGFCKALISEIAFRILNNGKDAVLTTERTNIPMRAAVRAIGMREIG